MQMPELMTQLYGKFGSWNRAARALDITEGAIYAWRDRRVIPGYQFVEPIARALGLAPDVVRETLTQAREARDLRRRGRGSAGETDTPLSYPAKPPAMVRPTRLMRQPAAAMAH